MRARKFKKLLIANRGEIALRIIRTARMTGLKTVAIYSEADARSTHVAAADDARLVGPAEASKSYLNIAAIIAAAKDSGADAIHPGYGFLSERAEFVRAVDAAGLIFVGPRAEVMAQLGDKISARKIATQASVPVVPGIETADLRAAREFGASAGYPILVKAAAGGGGRGMRVVESAANLGDALETAAHEAESAFGDGRLFIEKYLARPRHVEIQVLGDEHGTVAALGERDCSIQRRHQKLVEESPAPNFTQTTRDAMIDAATRMAQAAGYTNAGTVEFLLDGSAFYFLEVNARLQVEHPITEIRFGCDLVAEQLKIAMGERLGAISDPRGCALECRINAEDPGRGFSPATGAVIQLRTPGGPGVRFDTHLAQGVEVGAYYDGLLGKLICSGATREEVRRRMISALDELAIVGVTNTAGFLREVIASDAFARAELSTRFLEEHFPTGPHHDSERDTAALIAAALVAKDRLGSRDPQESDGARDSIEHSPWTEMPKFELWRTR